HRIRQLGAQKEHIPEEHDDVEGAQVEPAIEPSTVEDVVVVVPRVKPEAQQVVPDRVGVHSLVRREDQDLEAFLPGVSGRHRGSTSASSTSSYRSQLYSLCANPRAFRRSRSTPCRSAVSASTARANEPGSSTS